MKKKKVKKTAKKLVKKAKKKAVVKKSAGKPKKKTAAAKKQPAKKSVSIPRGASLEEVGVITHYFPKVDAAVVKLTKGTLSVGEQIIIKGHTSDFKEKVGSIQMDHAPIRNAEQGMEIGLKVKAKVREHDVVYKLLT
ncbi:MAG: EF-Tu/IF-2/RF-3 family GTPase [Candidatus Omnitrophota bacterium]|nr:EF-Tu/IF-2/RF-3 family GTPase [Candidatus Omnitrophota bacterium]